MKSPEKKESCGFNIHDRVCVDMAPYLVHVVEINGIMYAYPGQGVDKKYEVPEWVLARMSPDFWSGSAVE